jgi:polysaccharide export outer membrane protein
MMFCGSLAAQSQRVTPANPPVEKPPEAPKVPSQLSADTTGLPIDPKSYVIGPEDILSVRVWREPDFTGPKGVRPDGKITMPLVGDLQAAGLTPSRLSDQLKQALASYLKDPEIEVEVIQVNSKRYTVTGGVNRPGAYPLVGPKRVFEAVNDAGGFREFSNKKDVVIIRADGKRLHFNYEDYVKGKKNNKTDNLLLENGDTVFVKE